MSKYLFALGHQPHISAAEIKAVFSRMKITHKIIRENKNYLIIETAAEINPAELINRLGGTIKIAEEIKQNYTELNKINDSIIEFLIKNQTEGKIVYSISGNNSQKIALQIKKNLKAQGHSVRYIKANNTATILYNKLVEKQGDFTIIDNAVFVTRAIQPFEEFSERDYGRPGSDSQSGMLPPKLARILINLSEIKPGQILLDPFCGSGTILMEAAHMGYTDFIGSDISAEAISDTERNLEWLKTSNSILNLPYQLFCADVAELNHELKNKSVDAIITEPYLGKPLKGNENKLTLDKQTDELKNLYLSAFQTFRQILKPKGVIIFIIPRFRWKNSWIEIPCLAEIKKTGFEHLPFSSTEPYLLYSRPNQHLGREIWRFTR